MKGRETVADLALLMDLPQECLTDAARVTLYGRRQAAIEHHRGLLGYTPDAVEVSLGRGKVRLLGSELEVRAMDGETLLIAGHISAVEYE